MEQTISRKKFKTINVILVCLIVIIPLLMVFQGFDLDDTGTHLYNAIHLFDVGKAVTTKTFLSNFITYLFYQIFGGFGLLPLFLFNLLLYIVTAFLCFKITSDFIPKTIALTGVLIAEIAAMRFVHIVNYNTYSVLTVVLCCLAVYYGIVKDKNLYLFLAGLCTGFSAFFRLPNICVVLLGLGLIYWAFSTSMPFKKFLVKVLFYVAGIAVALLAVAALIFILNKFTNISIAFLGVKSSVSSTGSYSLWGLIDSYFLSFFDGLEELWFVFIPIVLLICNILCRKIENKTIRVVMHIVCIGLMVASLGYFAYCGITIYLLPALCWLVALITMVVCNMKKYFNRKLSLLCIIAVIATVIPFAGSNTGIAHANLALGLIFTIVIYAFYKLYKHFDLDKFSKVSCMICVLGFAIVFVYNYLILNVTSFELHRRSEVVYTVDSEKTKGLYTNKFRADYANTAIDVLSELDNEYMLIYPGYDLLYYLTDKTSYLGRSGIFFDSYSPEQLEHDIYAVEDKPLPIIMISKIRQYWYVGFSMDKFFNPDKKQEIIEEFMDKNNYEEYYSDENITVYIPQ